MGLDKALNIKIGSGDRGPNNLITDVPGVTVGHVTLKGDGINTGVTAIKPHGGNLFTEKVIGASQVFNGYGKSVGLMQVEELGTIETPIILTNTLSVGTASVGLIRYMMEQNPEIGGTFGTVNPLVCECNDGTLSDIRGLHIKEEHVTQALNAADVLFEEGAVGAGRGMSCFGLKGGIGSASRLVSIDGHTYTIGALTLTNFGSMEHLRVDGKNIGKNIKEVLAAKSEPDKGSIIMVIATDLPVNERQLKRICRRAGVGLARVGSYYGNGSGDIAVGFTTYSRLPHCSDNEIIDGQRLFENSLEKVFPLVADAVEEAILSSMFHAETVKGANGKIKLSINEFWGKKDL